MNDRYWNLTLDSKHGYIAAADFFFLRIAGWMNALGWLRKVTYIWQKQV